MQRVLDERIAFLVTDILSDNDARIPAFGENSPLQLPFPAAAKTGTTTDWRDNWTVGYTTEWVAGVWVGNASGEPMRHVTGVTGAAPIWNAVMRAAHVADPRPFLRPEGLVEASVCTDAARDVETTCPGLTRELFLDENAPGLTAKHRPFRSGGSTANAVPPAVDAERSASAEAGSLSDSREPDRENALVPKIQALMSASGQEEADKGVKRGRTIEDEYEHLSHPVPQPTIPQAGLTVPVVLPGEPSEWKDIFMGNSPNT